MEVSLEKVEIQKRRFQYTANKGSINSFWYIIDMETNKKDFASRRGLMAMVARRRKLLDFLIKTAEPRYQAIIAKLGIRK